MLNSLSQWLLDPSGLTPHGFCLLWQPGLIWTYAVSDLGIAIAYCTIPIALATFSRKRQDLVFRPVLWMFVFFILLCGASHSLDVLTLWIPAYGLEAVVKAATATVSLLTAFLLWRLLPQLIALPSAAQLQKVNSALHESKERHRASFEQSPVPVYTLNERDLISGVSDSWLALLGYARQEVVGRHIAGFHVSGSPPLSEDRQSLMEKSEILDSPRTLLKRDGTVVEALVSTRMDRTDGIEIIVGVIIDITIRRKAELELERARAEAAARSTAEAQLRQSNAVLEARLQAQQAQQETEARFQFATRAGRLGVWELDLQTGELTASAMCRDSFGYDADAPFSFGQMHEAISLYDRQRMKDAIELSRETGADFDGEYQVVWPKGAKGWIQMYAQVVGAVDGIGLRLAGISLDITERVRIEQRIRHSQQVEAVGRLTAGVAHDFNNVLQALLGGIELAIDELPDRPEIRADLELAFQAGQRGARLTSHLLSFSRQQTLHPASLDLTPLLKNLSRTLMRTLGYDITVHVEIAANLPHVLADAAHLDAALLNLALNARDAMPRGGELRIAAHARDGHIVIAVTDTGEGMTADVLVHACEPFFSTKGPKGSGLGLSMVQGFARQSGGELNIQSVPGQGTRIEISLPSTLQATAPEWTVKAMPVQGQGRVLIVDDEPDVGRVAAAFLRKAGFEVVLVADANAALYELGAGLPFNALVTDFAMPGMNGADLVLCARELCPVLSALIITGYAGAEGLDTLPSDVTILRKPFQQEDLTRKVKDLIETQITAQ